VIYFLLFSVTITLDQAVDKSLKKSPIYLQAKQSFQIQQKVNSLVYSDLLPGIYGGYDYTHTSQTTGGVSWSDTIRTFNLNLSWGLKPTDLIDAYSTHWKNSSVYYSFLEVRNGIVYQVASQYLSTLMLGKLLKSKEKAVQRTENNLLLVDEKLKLGSASTAELLKAKVDNLQAQYNFLDTKNLERVSSLNLKKLIGLEATDSISLSDPSIEFELPPKDSILELAEKTDPNLNEYRANVRSSRLNLLSRTTNQLFSISFSGSYGYYGEEFPTSSVLADNNNYRIGMSISVPLFAGFSRVNQVMISKLQLSLAEMRLKDREREIRISAEDAYLGYQESEQKLKLAVTTLKLAEESYKATEERYRLGEASIIELLGAEEDLLQAQYSDTQARFDWYLSIYKLKRIMGRLYE